MTTVPTPDATDFRTNVRVDYFAKPQDAVAFKAAKLAEGFNASGDLVPYAGERYPHDPKLPPTRFKGLYGVWWADRPDGWFYSAPHAER